MIKLSKKKIFKILSISLMVAMVAMCLSNIAFADMPDPSTMTGTQGSASGSINTTLNFILGIAQVVGVAVAVIMLIVLAIKYISAAPGDKAEIKKHAVVYIVGAVILFAATGILQIIKNFAGEAVTA